MSLIISFKFQYNIHLLTTLEAFENPSIKMSWKTHLNLEHYTPMAGLKQVLERLRDLYYIQVS